MNATKRRDLAAIVAAIVAQAPPLTTEQRTVIAGALNSPGTCERRPAQAAAAPADPAAVQRVGGRRGA